MASAGVHRIGGETMTKDVIVSVSGLQMAGGESDNIEVITAGDYYLKNGKHYVLYDEVMDGCDSVVKNTIRINNGCLEILRKGPVNAHMVFEKDKTNQTRYMTPVGELLVSIFTKGISMEQDEDRLKISLDYSLDINYERVSENNIVVDIVSKEKAQLRLS